MFNVQVKRKLNTQIIHFEVNINIFAAPQSYLFTFLRDMLPKL